MSPGASAARFCPQKKALDIYMQQQGGSDTEDPSSASAAARGLSGGAAGAAQASAAATNGGDAAAGSGEPAGRGGSNGSGRNGASATPVADSMRLKLTAELQPVVLDIVDNSHQHAGHAGASGRADAAWHSAAGQQRLAAGRRQAGGGARAVALHPLSQVVQRINPIPTLGPQADSPGSTAQAAPPPPPWTPPAGYKGSASYSGETHFTVEIVSPRFEGLTSIKRHRLVYGILAEELRSPVHALSLITKTPVEAGMD